MALEGTASGDGSRPVPSSPSATTGQNGGQHSAHRPDGSRTKAGIGKPDATDWLLDRNRRYAVGNRLEGIAWDLIEEWGATTGRTGPRWWVVDDLGRVGVEEPEWQAAFATDGAPGLGLWQTPPDDPAVLRLVAKKVREVHASAALVVLPGDYEPGKPESTDGQEHFVVQCWRRGASPLVVREGSTAVGVVLPGAWAPVEAALVAQ